MAMRVVRRLACVFRGHVWRVEHNRATQGTEKLVYVCGAHRSTIQEAPGDPEGPRPMGRSAMVT